jgi:hypothetical protein
VPFLDGSFGFGAGLEDGRDCIVSGHHVCFIILSDFSYPPPYDNTGFAAGYGVFPP